MAYMVLERLRNIGINTAPLSHKKHTIATLIGNLEWREVPNLLALFLPSLGPVDAVREEPHNDTASWMNRLLRFQSPTQSTASSPTPHPRKTTNLSCDTTAEAETPPRQGIDVTAEGRGSSGATPDRSQFNTRQSPSSKQTCVWTTVHAIFANMGGFRLAAETENGTMQYRTINRFQLPALLRMGARPHVPNVFKEQILDKSKTDAFARWLAILQCLWLLLELIVRKVKSLPSSQIEIATMAFACCSILTYLAVRHKPKDVDVLDLPSSIKHMEAIPSSPDPLFERPGSFFLGVFWYRYWQPEGYNGLIPGPGIAVRMTRRLRWGRKDPGERILNDNYLVRNYRSHPMAGWLVIGSTVFGGIHCLAWNFYFASRLERRLWRAAALVTTLAPLLLPIIDRGANSFQRLFKLGRTSTRSR